MFSFMRTTNGQIHPAVKAAGAATTAFTAIAIAAAFIAPFEVYAIKPYVDTVGTGHPITWCYGETHADGPIPPMGTIFTKAECTAELQESLTKKYYPYVQRCAPGQPPHRTAALVSFVYNLG